MQAKPVRGRYPQRAFQLLVCAIQLAGERQRLRLHALGVAQHGGALVGQDEALGGPLKQGVAQRMLQRLQPAAHGGLALLEGTACGTQRAVPGNGQEHLYVIPVHRLHHTKVNGKVSILWLFIQKRKVKTGGTVQPHEGKRHVHLSRPHHAGPGARRPPRRIDPYLAAPATARRRPGAGPHPRQRRESAGHQDPRRRRRARPAATARRFGHGPRRCGGGGGAGRLSLQGGGCGVWLYRRHRRAARQPGAIRCGGCPAAGPQSRAG